MLSQTSSTSGEVPQQQRKPRRRGGRSQRSKKLKLAAKDEAGLMDNAFVCILYSREHTASRLHLQSTSFGGEVYLEPFLSLEVGRSTWVLSPMSWA